MTVKVSLLIATYNWKEALNLSLLSALAQSVLPYEILVADDGSKDDTRMLIDEMRQIATVPIIHVWHEDKGFRLSAIRNKAIIRSSGDYIVQIDGDIILNRHFIKDHLDLIEEGFFVCGSRVLLSPEESDLLLKGQKDLTKVSHPMVLNGIRSRLLRSYLAERYAKNNHEHLRGCNMAFWRKDLIAVNGYNESFNSWCLEDSELVSRLLNLRIKKKSLKMGGVAFHIHHKEASRSGVERQKELFKQTVERGKVRTLNGLDKYIK